MSYLNQRVNTDSVMYAKVERGIWLKGKSAVVDRDGFKLKDAEYTPSEEFPIVMVIGKVLKSPQVYTDERGKVTTDYQDYLEKAWIKRLREKYQPIEINEEVWQSLQQ
jgi:peptidyl-prolyl cis-trans isomerase SurA